VTTREPVGVLARAGIIALAAVVGLVAGGAVGFVSQDAPAVVLDAGPPPSPPAVIRTVTPDTLLAWIPGGLPKGFAGRVRTLPGVANLTSVRSGVAWMTASFSEDGTRVDRPPEGLAVPLEVAGVDLRTYGAFLPPTERAAMESLARGQAVLGQTSARLRRLRPGALLRFGSRSVRVAAVLPDSSIGAHEVALSKEAAAQLGVTRPRYLLIDPAPGASRAQLSSAIRRALPAGQQVRIRGPDETPYFRQGDAVLPQVRIKELFGEFAARPGPDGFIQIDPAWASRRIVTVSLPVLGSVTCNRALIPQLRGALQEVARRGYAPLLDPADYGGCYSPRFLNRNPSAGLSHHAWGVALDVNVTANPFGRMPRQDPRVVRVFERWGFTWGGMWVVPDGMHFEFIRFAPGD
jgi:hypothetical protein